MADEIVIIGAGMAGCGATHQLQQAGIRPRMYDRKPYFGGHTASFTFEDRYTIDDGPHISFTGNTRLQEVFARSVGGEYETIDARVDNWWHGHRPRHPVQANLNGLPTDLVVRCIEDFVAASSEPLPDRVETYDRWLRAALGTTIAETFPMVYGRKYHTVGADRMSTDWLGPRIYRPTLDEVLRGALDPTAGDVHYVKDFRYPSKGGFVRYLDAFRDQADVDLEHTVVEVDPAARRIAFADGTGTTYDQLISTMPLPELIPAITSAPQDVRAAAQALACTTCVLVNVVVDREDLSDAHWTYVYDEDIPFARLSYPHMFSPQNTPPGTGAVQAEVYYSTKYRPLDHPPEDDIQPVVDGLLRMGVIREDDDVLFRNAWAVKYANIIFDLDRAAAVELVHGFLEEVGVRYAGRYGLWGYQWTDQAFASGEKAARDALDALGR